MQGETSTPLHVLAVPSTADVGRLVWEGRRNDDGAATTVRRGVIAIVTHHGQRCVCVCAAVWRLRLVPSRAQCPNSPNNFSNKNWFRVSVNFLSFCLDSWRPFSPLLLGDPFAMRPAARTR